jgi:hypothetical protein
MELLEKISARENRETFARQKNEDVVKSEETKRNIE